MFVTYSVCFFPATLLWWGQGVAEVLPPLRPLSSSPPAVPLVCANSESAKSPLECSQAQVFKYSQAILKYSQVFLSVFTLECSQAQAFKYSQAVLKYSQVFLPLSVFTLECSQARVFKYSQAILKHSQTILKYSQIILWVFTSRPLGIYMYICVYPSHPFSDWVTLLVIGGHLSVFTSHP